MNNSKTSISETFFQIRERNKRWSECSKHFFSHRPDGYRIGERIECQSCGVSASLIDIGNYIQGYMAAGGKSSDIMPDWQAVGGVNGHTGVVHRAI